MDKLITLAFSMLVLQVKPYRFVKANKRELVMQAAASIKNLKPSYIRTILKCAQQPGMISFAGGLPAESLFPQKLIQEITESVLREPNALQYSSTEGEAELIQAINEHEEFAKGSLLISHGAQQGLDLTARLFLNKGDSVVIEAPSYLGAIQVFQLAQANILGVTHSTEGPNLEQLEALFKLKRPKLFYCVPDFHNPTGHCWSKETRETVLKLAKSYGVILLEDAPYRALRFNGSTKLSLYELDQLESNADRGRLFDGSRNVVHLGSLSKVLAPGLRIGFIATALDGLEKLNIIKQTTDLHTSTLNQRIAAGVINHSEFQHHLAILKHHYRDRAHYLCENLDSQLKGRVKWNQPEGGMFLWVTAEGIDTDLLAQKCLNNGLAIVPSSVFYPTAINESENKNGLKGDDKNRESAKEMRKLNQSFRLNFSHSTPAEIEAGVDLLKRSMDQVKG